jgi:hypothetical protein
MLRTTAVAAQLELDRAAAERDGGLCGQTEFPPECGNLSSPYGAVLPRMSLTAPRRRAVDDDGRRASGHSTQQGRIARE